jgi:hypothetical protein
MKTREEVLRAAAVDLLELKKIKRRIEANDATRGERVFYEERKEAAWLALEHALSGMNGGYHLPSALEVQEGGAHYKTKSIQPVQYWFANSLDAFQGAVVKYITRFREKGGLLDLKKVIHYTQIYIELLYGVRSRIQYDDGQKAGDMLGAEAAGSVR